MSPTDEQITRVAERLGLCTVTEEDGQITAVVWRDGELITFARGVLDAAPGAQVAGESIDTAGANLPNKRANETELTSPGHQNIGLRADAILGLDAWNQKVNAVIATPAAPAAPAEHARPSDEQIMEIGFRHFKPDPDVTPTTRGAFIAAVREVLSFASQTTAPALSEPDPLQGAATWLKQAVLKCDVSDLMDRLLIGYNRAGRLFDAAPNQTPAPAAQGLTDAEIDRVRCNLDLPQSTYSDYVSWSKAHLRVFARAILAASRTTPKDGAK